MENLTLKQQKFVASYIETGNATQAVCDNYNVKDRKSAKVIACGLRKHPKIRQALYEVQDEAGITLEQLAFILNRGLDAKKVISHKGEFTESGCHDYSTQLEYLRLAHELRGDLTK